MKTLQLEGGGFPLNTKTFEQLRDMAEQLAHVVSQMAGTDKVIISGLEDQGADVYSDGWIVIEGELLPFVGGALGTHVTIIESVEQAQYLKDDDNNGIGDFVDAYIERYATFSNVATDNHLFDDFVRYEDLNGGVLKSGSLIFVGNTNTAIVGGDFIGVQTFSLNLLNGLPATKHALLKIDFEDIHSNYDVFVTNTDPSISFAQSPAILQSSINLETFVFNKSNTSIYILLASKDQLISNLMAQANFQITLIRKI